MIKEAVISDCGKFRLSLKRNWDENKPKVMFIMLNPSTADSEKDDPTIRRCISFASSWGYGGLVVGNLIPFRSSNPDDLLKEDNILHGDNIKYLIEMSKECEEIIFAWGNSYHCKIISKKYPNYNPVMELNADKFRYLELSLDGTPKHPLYLKSNLKPIKMFD